ncbi:hypothetical protein WJX79_006518 [Trebouxia sp. C0005]
MRLTAPAALLLSKVCFKSKGLMGPTVVKCPSQAGVFGKSIHEGDGEDIQDEAAAASVTVEENNEQAANGSDTSSSRDEGSKVLAEMLGQQVEQQGKHRRGSTPTGVTAPHLRTALKAFSSLPQCTGSCSPALCRQRAGDIANREVFDPVEAAEAARKAKVTSPSFVTPGNQSTTTCSRRVPMSAHCRADIRLSHQPVGPVLNALWLFGTH